MMTCTVFRLLYYVAAW